MPATASLLGTVRSTGNSTVYSATVDLGPESADRFIAVCGEARSGGATTVASVMIGGIAASYIAGTQSGSNAAYIYGVLVPAGASASIDWTWNVSTVRGSLQIYAIRGQNGRSGFQGIVTSADATGTATASGVAIAAGWAGANTQRATSSQARVSAGPVTARVSASATAVIWTGSFSVADYETQLSTSNSTPNVAAVAIFYDAPDAGIIGTGSGSLSLFTGSASGGLPVAATGSGTFSPFTGSSSATLGIRAAAAGTLDPFSGGGQATLPVKGEAGGTIELFTGSASGRLQIKAAGSGSLDAFTGSGAGSSLPAGIIGVAGGLLGRFTGEASGHLTARPHVDVIIRQDRLISGVSRQRLASGSARSRFTDGIIRKRIA